MPGAPPAARPAGPRPLAVVAAVAAGLGAAWLAGGGGAWLRARLESPEAGVHRALDLHGPVRFDGRTQAGLPFRAALDRARFGDLVVRASGDRAEVVGVADADGSVAWAGQEARLAYLGRERLVMVLGRAGWGADGGPLPRLAALLGTLVARAEAFDAADAGGYAALVDEGFRGPEGGKEALLRRLAADLGRQPRARLRVLAWQVRIERETAQVGEDFELRIGDGPPRRLRARFDLREEGGRWRFTGGL